MEEERGVSFGDILKMLKKHIIWILIVSVVVAVAAGLVIGLVYNKSKVTYRMSFMLQYPNSENKILPDETPFRYETIIYSENLNRVKQSSAEFSSVDVNAMMAKGDIRIEELTAPAEGVEQGIRYTGVYRITVSGVYFDNVNQASAFLKGLAELSIEDVLSKVGTERFSATISTFDSMVTYSEQIDCLVAQRDFLIARYNVLSPKYGDRTVDGKTLDSYAAEVAATLSNETVNRLRKDLSNNRYLLTETEQDILVSIEALNIEKEKNDSAIASLEAELDKLYQKYPIATGVTDSFETFHSRIAHLIERNAEIDVEIQRLYQSIGYEQEGSEWKKKADSVNSSVFSAELESLRNKLLNQIEICKNVVNKVYSDESHAVFGQDEAYAEQGGRNAILMAAFAFVAVFVVAAVIACCISYPKYKKSLVAAQTPAAENKEKEETDNEE